MVTCALGCDYHSLCGLGLVAELLWAPASLSVVRGSCILPHRAVVWRGHSRGPMPDPDQASGDPRSLFHL